MLYQPITTISIMVRFNFSMAAVFVACLFVLFGCNQDNVGPKEGGIRPDLAGGVGDPHASLDTMCQSTDTLFLVREDGGSPFINKCFGPAGPIACPPMQPKWGYVQMTEGYYDNTN